MSKPVFTNYTDCINFLFGLERAGIKYNLRNIKLLSGISGNPERKFKSIHIAGTNGKGSVASIINSVLIEKGFRTGLYSSPHISDFRERILINGRFISKKFILEYVNNIIRDIIKIKPSFFEVTTAMAFRYFYEEKVEYAVIETGLGGRLDSTNIVKPVVSVITSIGIDHTEFLGHKPSEIAAEKAGIIKRKVPAVIGNVPGEVKSVFRKISKQNNAELIYSGDKYKIEITDKNESGFRFRISGFKKNISEFQFPLTGDYQKHNIKTAFAALDELSRKEKFVIGNKEISNALKNIRKNSNLYGRFELISDNPKIIIDVSHNFQGIKNISSNLKYFRFKRLFIIFAMMSDKQFSECIYELMKLKASKIILTKPEYKRAADPEILFKSVKRKKNLFELLGGVEDSFRRILKESNKDDLILVTGSFFLVSDFLKALKKIRREEK